MNECTINKEFLFNQGVTDEQIFAYYFPLPIDISKSYVNPLRQSDDYPSCRFYRHNVSKHLYFRDPAYKTYDCFQWVMDMYGLNYLDACEKIYYDLGVLTGIEQPRNLIIKEKEPVTLRVLRKNFTKQQLDFWRNHDDSITAEDLESGDIYSLSAGWLNDRKFYNYKYGDLAFFYHLRKGYNYQCYNPKLFFEGIKFITSPNNYIVGHRGLKKNHPYVVITKSGKCTFFVKRFGVNNFGILTETMVISNDIFSFLVAEGTIVFTLFDNDRTGKHLSWLYRKKYKTIPLFFTKDDEKDFSDNLLKYGKQYMIDYIDYVRDLFNIKEL